MSLNVSGQEGATGISDPTIMFQVFGTIMLIVIIVGSVYGIIQLFNK